jgi:DNA-binding NarL/FixJ family response regulator
VTVRGDARSNVARLPGTRAPGDAISVLVATNDSTLRIAIEKATLKHDGLVVTARAKNAAEAVQLATRTQPDICLLDIDMHGSEIDPTWEIRTRLPRTKIVLMSLHSSDEQLLAAVKTGIDGFLFKDMNLERVPNALIDVFNGKAALPRAVTARLLTGFRTSGPSWRPIAGAGPRKRITAREWEVLELLEQELSTYEIAERLVLSASAVRCHISAAVRKLGAADRGDALRLLRQGAA